MELVNLWKDELIQWLKRLASAGMCLAAILIFGFRPTYVEGHSMAPTLSDRDMLIVNKLAYRTSEPRHGDIVTFHNPIYPDKSQVKRVIAEEGDRLRIVDGRVFVNDVPMRDDFVPRKYRSYENLGPIVIRKGYCFVMGDHRNRSSDSRHWGQVPKNYITGRVQLRWWPIPHSRLF